ncbi:MAG: hypothetical protein ACTSUB_04765 [Candidatus Thorarchaeota archaeon]
MKPLYRRNRESGDEVSNEREDYARRQILGNLRGIAFHLIECIQHNFDRSLMISHHSVLEEAVDRLWSGVQEGRYQVESMSMLRMVKHITCPDLKTQLERPNLQHEKIIRELRLFVNTVEHVIVPKQAFTASYSNLLDNPI